MGVYSPLGTLRIQYSKNDIDDDDDGELLICVMFTGKVTDVRDDLVVRIKVDELLLDYMMEKSVITSIQKTDLLYVGYLFMFFLFI